MIQFLLISAACLLSAFLGACWGVQITLKSVRERIQKEIDRYIQQDS